MDSEERNKDVGSAAVVGDVEPIPSAAAPIDELSEKDKEAIEAINTLKDLDAKDEDDLEVFAKLLLIPDDTFRNIEDALMSSLEKELSNANTALQLAQSLNISGATSEELEEAVDVLCENLEKELKDLVTPYKMQFLRKYFALIVNAVEKTFPVSNRIVEIPIEICRDGAKIPEYANIGDAGLDVYALEDYEILPGETRLIPTGLKVAIPKGYELQVRPRSGLSLRTKMRIANAPGTIK